MTKSRKDLQGWTDPADTTAALAVLSQPDTVAGSFDPHDVMDFQHFKITPIGMIVKGRPEFDEWKGLGYWLNIMVKGIQFNVGDWIAFGEGEWGDKVAQVVDSGRWKYETVRNLVWVAAKVPITVRRHELEWTHHQEVAHVNSVDQQRVWLQRAVENHWTAKQLKKAIDGEDLEPDKAYIVVVKCLDEADQQECARQLTNLQRTFVLKMK